MMIATNLSFRLKRSGHSQEFCIDKERLSIGRDPNSDIVLDQGYPSRTHAQIFFKESHLYIEDLNSTNGTFVNNQKLYQATRIVPGDLIKFGSVEYSLLPDTMNNQTIISKIPVVISDDASYVVQDQIKVDPNSTGVFQSYPLPFGWPVDNCKAKSGFHKKSNKLNSTIIDQHIKHALAGEDTVYIAALVINPSAKHPQIYGLSLESQQNSLSIGRSKQCSITIQDPSISEHHANLEFKQEAWVLTDYQSTNGLRSENKKITEINLKHGSEVNLGQIEVTFRNIPWAL